MSAALKQIGWDTEQVHEVRATAYGYLKQGHYKVAINLLEGLVGLKAFRADDLHTLGALYVQVGKLKRAHNYLQQALALEPAHHGSLLNLAKLHCMQGEIETGLEIARYLAKSEDKEVADLAEALHMAYDKRWLVDGK